MGLLLKMNLFRVALNKSLLLLFLGYKDILKTPNPEEVVNEIFEAVDVNDSGKIDYTGCLLIILYYFIKEFVMATINRENLLSK